MKSPYSEENIPFPHVKGQQFTVRSHIPPPPTPLEPGFCEEGDTGKLERKQLHPIDRCLLHPPLPGSDGSLQVAFQITEPLQVGDHRRAQLLLVNIIKTNSPAKYLGQGKKLVAKIYDPLYAADENAYLNPFLLLDKNYTHETAAYTRLSDLQGSLIPQYYGSFSLEFPTNRYKPRHVRLILIQFIQGSSMQNIDPGSLSQSHRKHIIKSIIDFTTLIYTRDMVNEDLYPRNIMVVCAGTDKQKVVFIDFEDMRFTRTAYVNPELEAETFPGTYISPLLRWHEAQKPTLEFSGWVDWEWQPWLETEYGHTRHTITEEMREIFLPDFLLNPVPIERVEELYWNGHDEFD